MKELLLFSDSDFFVIIIDASVSSFLLCVVPLAGFIEEMMIDFLDGQIIIRNMVLGLALRRRSFDLVSPPTSCLRVSSLWIWAYVSLPAPETHS